MEKKLNKPTIYSLSIGAFAILAGSLFFMSSAGNNSAYNYDDDYQYVSKLFDNGLNEAAVAKTTETMVKPFTNENVKAVKNFYDYKGAEADQEKAIINYEQTYIQNNGIAYGADDTFDVVSVLSGTVLSVKEDKLQGKIVEIEHENNVITTYKSLSEVTVNANDQVEQGMIIGKSGKANINKDLGNHMVFEVNASGSYINPDTCFGKDVKNLQNG